MIRIVFFNLIFVVGALTTAPAYSVGEGVRVYNRSAGTWSASTVLQGPLQFTEGNTQGFITKFGRIEKLDKVYNLVGGQLFRLAISGAQNRKTFKGSARLAARSKNEVNRPYSIKTGVARLPDLAEKVVKLSYEPPKFGDVIEIPGAEFGNVTTGAGALDTDFVATVISATDEEISKKDVLLACPKQLQYSGTFFVDGSLLSCTLYELADKEVEDTKIYYDIGLRVGLFNSQVNGDAESAFAYFDSSYKTVVKSREVKRGCEGTGKKVLVCGGKTYDYSL